MVIRERLRVVRERTDLRRPVLERDPLTGRSGPLFPSFGLVTLLCGDYSFALMVGIPTAKALRDVIPVCPVCGAWNETWEAFYGHGGPT